MKRLLFLTIFTASLFDTFAQYNASMIGFTNETITLRCTGYGKNASKASNDAEISAIKSLLFHGIPNSKYRIAFIQGNQAIIEQDNKPFFENFYKSEYKNFIEESVIATPFDKNENKQKCITLDIEIKASNLKSYLEKQGLIRKFGL
ncbi:MAG: hypothetical protein E7081_06625 [Bacteroidales bacterium]|nr:hypothetical protein [Bacteroidales bacterium]